MKMTLTAVVAAMLLALAATASGPTGAVARQEATPAVGNSCNNATPVAGSAMMDHDAMGTPMAGMDHGGMAVGTPMAGMGMEAEFDRLYIEMMIPHHESIVAMAEAALPRLTDERLRAIARAVVATQRPEIDELRDLRARFYGDTASMPMDDRMMDRMDQAMPGMAGSMDEMRFQMDPAAQVATVCAADNLDLTFIDLTIPHHESAIAASEAALDRAVHPETRAFAQRVIDAQRAEIEALTLIRQELAGAGTPASGT
jgi:uncharacterized protein (DUF305 family)